MPEHEISTTNDSNVSSKSGTISTPVEYIDVDTKDENLITSLKLLLKYNESLVLKYSSLLADINTNNITIKKILSELEKT